MRGDEKLSFVSFRVLENDLFNYISDKSQMLYLFMECFIQKINIKQGND